MAPIPQIDSMLEKYSHYSHLEASTPADGVLMLALNRPEKKNAIGVEMTFELAEAFRLIFGDEAVRVLLLKGAGGNFSTGMDVKEFFGDSSADADALQRAKNATHDIRASLLRSLPQPTIALVEGFCLGGAISLVESCDIVLCAEDAVFGLPEINFGFFPGGAVAKALMQKMSQRQFSYFALSGRNFTGAQAVAMGLATEALHRSLLTEKAYELARELAKKDPVALEMTKDAIHHVEAMSWEAVRSYHAGKLVELSQRQTGHSSRDSQVRSFLLGESKPGNEQKKMAGD
jgi:trans-feruloyl-CoA hydratase/vanillin synthase